MPDQSTSGSIVSASLSFFCKRRFFPLFCTQFLGAFNDNLLRIAMMVLIGYQGLHFAGLAAEQLVNLVAAVFILPFFLFSASAGQWAECVDKAQIARWIKLAEIVIMLIASLGFLLQSAACLLLALFLMGTHSAFFGPIKYSVLPQYLQPHELIGGNALIEMGTFLAILFGQIGGSLLAHQSPWLTSTLLLLTAVIGYAFSLRMPYAAPTARHLSPSFNVIGDSYRLLKQAWRIKPVRSAILGISWFWLLGSIYTTQLPSFTRLHLGGDASVYTCLLALFSIGIGLGSLVCANLSAGQLPLGLVLLGSLGMSASGADLAFVAFARHHGALLDLTQFLAQPQHWRALADLTLLGFFGAFFTVPLYTWLQQASPDRFRSQAIAANNLVNGFYMVFAAGASAALLYCFNNLAFLFLMTALVNLLATLHLLFSTPEIRQACWRFLRRA